MSCCGQEPLDDTFQRFVRPVRFVVSATSVPSGDSTAPSMIRVTNRSSTGTGFALGPWVELTDFGSVICRSLGPEIAAAINVSANTTPKLRSSLIGQPPSGSIGSQQNENVKWSG